MENHIDTPSGTAGRPIRSRSIEIDGAVLVCDLMPDPECLTI